jgi:hypothetical protein
MTETADKTSLQKDNKVNVSGAGHAFVRANGVERAGNFVEKCDFMTTRGVFCALYL